MGRHLRRVNLKTNSPLVIVIVKVEVVVSHPLLPRGILLHQALHPLVPKSQRVNSKASHRIVLGGILSPT